MVYPMPANLTNMTSIATYANSVTYNWFWNIILLSLVAVSLLIALSRGMPKEEAFVISTFFGMIFAGLMASLAIVKSVLLIIFVLLFATAVALLWFRGEKTIP